MVQIKGYKKFVLEYRGSTPYSSPNGLSFSAFDDASMPMNAIVYKRHAVGGDWVSVQACPMIHWP